MEQHDNVKTDRRILKTRRAIIDAYYELLCDTEQGKITVAAISRKANIDRKTFYLHYDSVEDVLRAFCLDQIHELTSWMDSHDFYHEPMALLPGIFVKLNEILTRDARLYRHLAEGESFSFFWNQVSEILVNALTNFYAPKVKPDEQTFRVYCEFFISGILHCYQNYLRDPEAMSMDSISVVIQDILYHGVQNLF